MDALTEAQQRELNGALETLRSELGSSLRTLDEASRPVDLDEPIGRLSRVDAIQQQNMARANRQTTRSRLAQVEAALTRCADDEYGLCLACGEDIGYARLRARPEAVLCIACQNRSEQR